MDYEFVPHTADLKMRVYGTSQKDLFAHAMEGMFAALEPEKKIPEVRVKHTISLTAPNQDILLVDFLAECLYLSDTENESYDRVQFNVLDSKSCKAVIEGYKIKSFKGSEIKAVTFHDFQLHHDNSNWTATIVFDI